MVCSGGATDARVTTPAYNLAKTPSYGMGGRTPMHGNHTPSYGAMTPSYGGMTPFHTEFGSRTPQHGSMTPGRDGSMTPGRAGAWDPTNPNTPARLVTVQATVMMKTTLCLRISLELLVILTSTSNLLH